MCIDPSINPSKLSHSKSYILDKMLTIRYFIMLSHKFYTETWNSIYIQLDEKVTDKILNKLVRSLPWS